MTGIRRASLLVGLVVVSLVAGAVVPVASASQSDGEPAFAEEIVTDDPDSVAEIAIENVSDGETATVFASDEDGAFVVEADVTDGDGDGRVRLSLDTDAAGDGDPGSYLSVGDGDDLAATVQHSEAREAGLPPGNYALNVSVGGETTDVATLFVRAEATSDDGDADDGNGDDADGGNASESTTVANTSFDVEGETLTVTAAPGRTIGGTTDLAAGSRVEVTVQSENDTAPYLNSEPATVAENGSFAATFDLSNVPPETAIAVAAEHDGRTLAETTGRVVRCTENCTRATEWPELASSVVTGAAGETVAIEVAVPESADRANLSVGEDGDGFAANATLVDANGDGRIVVSLDTAAAGDGDPGGYLSVGDGDEIASAEQPTATLEGGLDAGNYELAVGPEGAPYDVGTLALSDGDGTGEAGTDQPASTGEVTFVAAGDTLRVGNVADQRIHAESSLPSNASVRFTVASADPSEPFLVRVPANVSEYGTLTTTVDLSTVDPNTTLEITAGHDGETVGRTDARVVDCAGGCPAIANGQPANASTGDGANASTGGNASDDGDDANVVAVDRGGPLPLVGLGALGLGGLLSLLGVARFTGLLQR